MLNEFVEDDAVGVTTTDESVDERVLAGFSHGASAARAWGDAGLT